MVEAKVINSFDIIYLLIKRGAYVLNEMKYTKQIFVFLRLKFTTAIKHI